MGERGLMRDPANRGLPTVLAALTALSLATAGCGESRKTEHFRTARVTGTVRVGSAALSRGWVEFLPTDGGVGLMRSAPIGTDGTFVVDRVAVGKNAVGITGAGLPRGFGRRFDSLSTPIRRTIPDVPSAAVSVDLLVEEALYQKDAVAAAAAPGQAR